MWPTDHDALDRSDAGSARRSAHRALGTSVVVCLVLMHGARTASAQVRSSFDPIFFASGSAEVRPIADDIIRAAARWLVDHPDGRLVVEGHADRIGPAAVNLVVSRRRAEAVRDALIDLGVSPAKIAIVASGETEPVSHVRALNRRVDIWATSF